MTKPVVFVSHIEPETELAVAFTELVAGHFPDQATIFVACDSTTHPMGLRWLEEITDNLKQSVVAILLCSRVSVETPWTHFAAGAVAIRGVPMISLCHSGMTASSLPAPLNLLQAGLATRDLDLERTFDTVAKALAIKAPPLDFSGFIARVRAFEDVYTFWRQCNAAFEQLERIVPGLTRALKASRAVPAELTETQIRRSEGVCAFLTTHDVLELVQLVGSTASLTGVTYQCLFSPLTRYAAVTADIRFKPDNAPSRASGTSL